MYRVRGAILIGIFLTAVISWPRPTAVTYFPHTPAGDEMFEFFKKVVAFKPLSTIGGAIEVCAKLYLRSVTPELMDGSFFASLTMGTLTGPGVDSYKTEFYVIAMVVCGML
jgi:xanthine/uracil/vitamin C permease (AzgA family)